MLKDAVAMVEVEGQEHSCLLDGTALPEIFDKPVLSEMLIKVFKACTSVVVFRCSPDEKAQIINFVRQHQPEAYCVAIGDGGNDINMIQTAQIGVGIEGNEGNQAAFFADFSIQEFQGLRRLILWHGRQFGMRAFSVFLPQSIMKGHIFMAQMFWSNWANGFSGIHIYQYFYFSLYNVMNTNINAVGY